MHSIPIETTNKHVVTQHGLCYALPDDAQAEPGDVIRFEDGDGYVLRAGISIFVDWSFTVLGIQRYYAISQHGAVSVWRPVGNPTFDIAWAKTGRQYGRSERALVRLGWDMAQTELAAGSGLDDEKMKKIMLALVNALEYAEADELVRDYFMGVSVLSRIGRRGLQHLNAMMGLLGRDLPAPADES